MSAVSQSPDPTRRWNLDSLQAALGGSIKRLQREVRRTKAHWHALRADVPEAVETEARTAYQDASWKYLAALENYFAMTEQHRMRQHHGTSTTRTANADAGR